LKNVDPSCKSGKTSSWESLRKMFLNIQKDYKLKHQRYKISGNHSNSFIDFCHGRLGTCYQHIKEECCDVLERHLQMKTEAKSVLDAVKSQKAAAYQLKSYCLGMNQLLELSGKDTANFSDEQNDLMARMKSTLGAAINAIETHIKSGTVWCPTTVDNQQKTPKFSTQTTVRKKVEQAD
jgi:hypothetical protein